MLIRDVTEQKQMEQAYASGQKRFQSLIERAPDGIALLGQDGVLKHVTPSAENILGYGPAEVEGQDPAALTHPEDLPALMALLNDLIQTPGKVVRTEYRFRHKDGSWRWLNSTISNLLMEPGVESIVFNYRDVTERKQAEAVLQASEKRYRLLFEENPLPLWVYDTVSLRFLAVNDAAVAYYGYERGELLQMTIREIRPPEELPRLEAYLSRPRPSNEHSGPWKYRKKDGTLIDVEVVSNETTYLGKPARLVLTNDITEQLQAKAALATSELRFRSLIENSADGITVVDDQGMVKYVSPSVERLLGYTQTEAIGQQAMDYVHPEDRLRLLENVACLYQAGAGHPVLQYRFKHKDGSWHWLESTLARQEDEGTGQGIVFNYRDVTERNKAEKELETVYGQLRHLFDNLDEVFFSMDTVHWTVLQMSPACEKLYGQPASAFFEDPELWRRFIHPDDLHIIDANFPKLYTGESVLQSYRIQRPDGKVRWVEVKLKPTLDLQGSLIRVDGLLSDITGRKQAEEDLRILNLELEKRVADRTIELNRTNAELEHANRAKDEFLANMSHELRTPLNSILGLSESLLEQRRGPLNEQQQHSLRVIESSGVHLLDLINDILDLSKIEAGKFDFYPETIRVEDMVQSSLSFVKSQAMKKSIKLFYEADPAISTIHADPRRLKQILVNLLTNAVKFTPEQGQVTLQVCANAKQNLVRFSVIDTGIGIAAKDLARLFRPFEQVDSQLNRQFEGSGLGLVLVQKLTDLHGGSVHVESDAGKGSCFTINLPWEKERELQPGRTGPDKNVLVQEPSGLAEKSVDAVTILLAEDHVANILTIGEYLESYGYQVVVAHNGAEALEKAQEADPALILTDIQMPVIDGLEVIRRLRAEARFARTPIIALTALAMPGDRERCLLAGANEYMSKPVSLKSLVKTIHELVLQFPPEKRA